jgi:hypothetical protein
VSDSYLPVRVMSYMLPSSLADALLAFDPLDINHVKRCNQAEAEFWASNEGYQTKASDELLQFDCGGQVSRYILEVVQEIQNV